MYKAKSKTKPIDKPIADNIAITKIVNIDDNIDIIKLVKRLNPDLINVILDTTSYNIVYYMDMGYNITDICHELKLSFSSIELLKMDNALFAACLVQLSKNRILNMEDKLLSSFDNASDNIKMFSMKGNDPKYRDNFLPQIQGVSRILIEFSNGDQLNTDAGKISGNNPIDITEDNTNI